MMKLVAVRLNQVRRTIRTKKKPKAPMKVNEGQVRKDSARRPATLRKIVRKERLGLKIKAYTMFQYVLNQILLRYLIIPSG